MVVSCYCVCAAISLRGSIILRIDDFGENTKILFTTSIESVHRLNFCYKPTWTENRSKNFFQKSNSCGDFKNLNYCICRRYMFRVELSSPPSYLLFLDILGHSNKKTTHPTRTTTLHSRTTICLSKAPSSSASCDYL